MERIRRQRDAPKKGAWTIEQLSVDALLGMQAPYNPRKISPRTFQTLRDSIRRDGFLQNIVCNRRTNHVIGGHQRIRAAQAEGMSTLPVYWVDVDDATEKRINLALNKIAGEFVPEALRAVLGDLDDAARSLAGFDERELERLMRVTPEEAATEPLPEVNRSMVAVLTLTNKLAEDKKFLGRLEELCEEFRVPYRLRKGS